MTLVLHAAGVMGAVTLWWLLTLFLQQGFEGFGPWPTLKALLKMLPGQQFRVSLIDSMCRLLGGLGIAVAIGVPVGIMIGYFRRLNELSYILFQFLRMISPLSWMPIAVIVFGVARAGRLLGGDRRRLADNYQYRARRAEG